jgi:CTP:molybdopterin cytidylyltransferase MocA
VTRRLSLLAAAGWLNRSYRPPLEGGAKTVVRAHEQEVINVPVADEGSLVDIDPPKDDDALR